MKDIDDINISAEDARTMNMATKEYITKLQELLSEYQDIEDKWPLLALKIHKLEREWMAKIEPFLFYVEGH